MVLYLTDKLKNRYGYPIRGFQDFYALYDYAHPQLQEAVMSARTVDQAVTRAIAILSAKGYEVEMDSDDGIYGHHDAYGVTPFTKGFGQKIKAAGMAGLMSLSTAHAAPAEAPAPQAVPPPQSQQADDFGTNPMDRFLWTIMQVESSGGRNTAHKMVQHGMHAGEAAMGRWGLMPNTVREMVKRAQRSNKSNPALDMVASLDGPKMADYIKKNPQVELSIARSLAQHVMRRQGYNRHKAAYAWTMGHNLFSGEVPTEDLANHPYVKMFDKFHKLNPIRPQKVAPMSVVQKSDGSTFRERYQDWSKRRAAQARRPAPKDSTYVLDPGRKRDPELDEKDQASREVAADVRSRIKQRIRQSEESDPRSQR